LTGIKEQYQFKIINRNAALENLENYGGDISRPWERGSIRENIKASATEILGYYMSKQHKP
jgi:hypothetical protein